jgi:hypothetical protein
VGYVHAAVQLLIYKRQLPVLQNKWCTRGSTIASNFTVLAPTLHGGYVPAVFKIAYIDAAKHTATCDTCGQRVSAAAQPQPNSARHASTAALSRTKTVRCCIHLYATVLANEQHS